MVSHINAFAIILVDSIEERNEFIFFLENVGYYHLKIYKTRKRKRGQWCNNSSLHDGHIFLCLFDVLQLSEVKN